MESNDSTLIAMSDNNELNNELDTRNTSGPQLIDTVAESHSQEVNDDDKQKAPPKSGVSPLQGVSLVSC